MSAVSLRVQLSCRSSSALDAFHILVMCDITTGQVSKVIGAIINSTHSAGVGKVGNALLRKQMLWGQVWHQQN